MKMKIEAREMARAVKNAIHVINKKNSVPVLGMVRVKHIGSGKVSITGTDVDTYVSTTVDAIDCDDDFDILAPARLLLSATRYGGATPVTLSVENREETRGNSSKSKPVLQVCDGDSSYIIDTPCPVADWPEASIPDMVLQEKFTNGRFSEIASKVARTISTEETRYYLNGIFWENGIMTSTDGHRLTSHRYETESEELPGMIIPRWIVMAILSLGKGLDVSAYRVKDTASGKIHLKFTFGGIEVYGRSIDGTFPDYRRVIPKKAVGHDVYKFDAARLYSAVERFVNFKALTGNNAIRFFEKDGLIHVGDKPESSLNEAAFTANTFAPWPEDAEAFGVNMHYLIAFLPKAGTVSFTAADPGSPIHIDVDGEEGVTRIIMPMRV